MSDRGESYADGGFCNQNIAYPSPERIRAINTVWEHMPQGPYVDPLQDGTLE